MVQRWTFSGNIADAWIVIKLHHTLFHLWVSCTQTQLSMFLIADVLRYTHRFSLHSYFSVDRNNHIV
jgi:hypothetical protein